MQPNPAHEFFYAIFREAARAIDRDDLISLRQLVQGQALNQRGEKEMSLLWYAIQSKKHRAVSELVRLGAKPDEDIVQGLGSALQFAIETEAGVHNLKAMLDGGLNPNIQMQYGKTLLQRAMTSGEWTLPKVQLLVERGADVNLRDSIGGSALDGAINLAKTETAIYLIEKGADVQAVKTNGDSVRWGVEWHMSRMQPGTEKFQKFDRLRALMISKGAKFPAEPPAKMRVLMKSQGINL